MSFSRYTFSKKLSLPDGKKIIPSSRNMRLIRSAIEFDAIAYTGNGSTQNITGLGFQPDVTLIKNRGQTDSWCHQNSTLGVGKTQAIDTAAAVASETDCVTAFNSDGSEDTTVTPAEDDTTFREYKYSVDSLKDFTTFQLKIELTGSISSYPPKIKDMRAIALAV